MVGKTVGTSAPTKVVAAAVHFTIAFFTAKPLKKKKNI